MILVIQCEEQEAGRWEMNEKNSAHRRCLNIVVLQVFHDIEVYEVDGQIRCRVTDHLLVALPRMT